MIAARKTMLVGLRTLSEKNKISCEMKKPTHTAGTKSYACWFEDMVSHLLFKKYIYDSSYFSFTAIFSKAN